MEGVSEGNRQAHSFWLEFSHSLERISSRGKCGGSRGLVESVTSCDWSDVCRATIPGHVDGHCSGGRTHSRIRSESIAGWSVSSHFDRVCNGRQSLWWNFGGGFGRDFRSCPHDGGWLSWWFLSSFSDCERLDTVSEHGVVHKRHVTQRTGEKSTVRFYFPGFCSWCRVPSWRTSGSTVGSGWVQCAKSSSSLYRFFDSIHTLVVATTPANRLGEVLKHGPGRMVEVAEVALYPWTPGHWHVIRCNSSHSKQIRLVTD